MLTDRMGGVARLPEAQVPAGITLPSMGRFVAFVQIKIETRAAAVLILRHVLRMAKGLWQDIGAGLVLALALVAFALFIWLRPVAIPGLIPGPPSGVPKPLRADDHPNGLPGLKWMDRHRVSQANRLYHLTAELVSWGHANQCLIAVENPQSSLFWTTAF